MKMNVYTILLLFTALWNFVEGTSLCPKFGKKNYGSDHCEVLSFVARDDDSEMMSGTVWVNDGKCNDQFFNVTMEDIAAVWPEAEVIKKNGPRMWMTTCAGFDSLDTAQARMTMADRKLPKRSLAGTMYAAQAQIHLPRADAKSWGDEGHSGNESGEKGAFVNRSVVFAWEAGLRVFELISPDGWPYIMQSMSMQVDTNLTAESLKTLGDRLTNLAQGWSYRSRILETGIAVRGRPDGVAMVKQDQFENSYSRYDAHNGVTWWGAKVQALSVASTTQAPSTAPNDGALTTPVSSATAVLPTLLLRAIVFASASVFMSPSC